MDQGALRKLLVWGLVALASITVAARIGRKIQSQLDALNKLHAVIKMPGQADVHLGVPGSYVLHHVYQVAMAGTYYTTGSRLENFSCALVSSQDGGSIPLETPPRERDSMLDQYFGKSYREFQIARPGPHHLSCGFSDDMPHNAENFYFQYADRERLDKAMFFEGTLAAVCGLAGLVAFFGLIAALRKALL